MDNYKLYANLISKPDSSNLSAVPCEVEKWIPINHWTFEQIKRSPLKDLDVIKAYKDLMKNLSELSEPRSLENLPMMKCVPSRTTSHVSLRTAQERASSRDR